MESSPRDERAEKMTEYLELARQLAESGEVFSFPGVEDADYAEIKASEDAMPDYAEYAAPIDELAKRFESEGMKVVLGNNPNYPACRGIFYYWRRKGRE